ncbi:MAG: LacI family DNA-binding transcriptional regulator [Flavobacteriaceae bacterium]|nr:LacI family DNA-binding transcriptional regulator [Flavobacteriaceae bacterium]
MKKITLKDIAKAFNVSISTVSKALNDSDEISETTKLKIHEYAQLHNYKPNLNALSLKSRKTKTIGIVIPDMLNYFFAQVLKGIEKVALENDHKVIICISNESYKKEAETIEMLSNGSVDGFIISISEETETIKDFEHFNKAINFGLPIVMFDRVANSVKCDKVITDNYKAAASAVKKLVNNGCRNIAFISSISHLRVSDEMLKGYKQGLINENIIIKNDLIINSHEDHYSHYEALLKPLFKNKVDGILATNESLAIAAMKIAQKKGFNIPNDISVIGFSNGILARHSNPKLTTISQHGEIIGNTAAKILIDKLKSDELNKDFSIKVIKTDLVERNSTIH